VVVAPVAQPDDWMEQRDAVEVTLIVATDGSPGATKCQRALKANQAASAGRSNIRGVDEERQDTMPLLSAPALSSRAAPGRPLTP
jgi:hypothetical protein